MPAALASLKWEVWAVWLCRADGAGGKSFPIDAPTKQVLGKSPFAYTIKAGTSCPGAPGRKDALFQRRSARIFGNIREGPD